MVIAVAATAVIAAVLPSPARADTPLAGSAGTPVLPPTDSPMTVSGRDQFQDLRVTVGQTKGLINQAISVSWSGARPTSIIPNAGKFVGDYFQIFQCWGDASSEVPANPGPPPEQCEFGGLQSSLKALGQVNVGPNVATRVVGQQGVSTYDPHQGVVDDIYVWKPFRGVDGTEIGVQRSAHAFGTNVAGAWLNTFFDANSTNEVPLGATTGDGKGTVIFTADTGLEAPGLGCGQKVQRQPDGSRTTPKCWLVIVPRGTPDQENPPEHHGSPQVETSPLAPLAWKNRIAVPLEFTPIETSCAIGADERRIVGSELATPAITSWQPVLCSTANAPPYSFASISDGRARQELTSGASSAAGMAVVSRPIDPAATDPANPVVYAPLTLSGVSVAFNIERKAVLRGSLPKDPAEVPLGGSRVATVHLTPRLVAKLLSQSYRYLYNTLLSASSVPKGYESYLSKPNTLLEDPDFRQFNPEFENLYASEATAAFLIVEQPGSDAAYQLWHWILADPEASAWMSGMPDPWGMTVNPYYNTKADLNPSHQGFADPVPDGYPKSDPLCTQNPTPIQSGQLARPACLLDIQPYVSSMEAAALTTRAGIDGHRSLNLDALVPESAYVLEGPVSYPSRTLLSVTDTASAVRYGLQTAMLSAAGDDTPGRGFVAPDPAGLLAGAKAMTPSPVPEVLQSNPASTGTGAYPLTMLTYAAVTPRSLPAASRPDYAAFVTYAAGAGQAQGVRFGNLPPGYAPLPSGLVDQAKLVAAKILSGDPAPPNSPPSSGAPSAASQARPLSGGVTGGNGSTQTGPSTPGTATATPLKPPVPRHDSPPPLNRVLHTIAVGVGTIRYTLPAAMVIAILAALGALVLRKRRWPGSPPVDEHTDRGRADGPVSQPQLGASVPLVPGSSNGVAPVGAGKDR